MSSKSSIHVGIYDTWADWEAGYTLAHLASGDWNDGEGYRVVTVAATADPIVTKGGVSILPDMAIGDVSVADSALLLLPGADSWLHGANREFADLASEFLGAGVPVAAICGATLGLASAGLLNTHAHTSNDPAVLAAAGERYTGASLYRHEPCVSDGDLITASGVAPVEFARAIFDRLEFYTPQTSENWYRLYRHQDPAGFFGLMREHANAQ